MTTKRTIVIAAAVGLTLAVGAFGAVSAFKPQVALYAAAIAGEGGTSGAAITSPGAAAVSTTSAATITTNGSRS